MKKGTIHAKSQMVTSPSKTSRATARKVDNTPKRTIHQGRRTAVKGTVRGRRAIDKPRSLSQQLVVIRGRSLASTVRPIRKGSIQSYDHAIIAEISMAVVSTAVLAFVEPLIAWGFVIGVVFMGLRSWAGIRRYGR